MKLKDILKTVGSSVVRETIPGGGLIVDAVNALLPDHARSGREATGDDVKSSIGLITSPNVRSAILNRDFDVQVEKEKTVQTMLQAEAQSTQSTRPYIAKHSFHVVAIVALALIATLLYAVLTDNKELVISLSDSWQFVLALIGPFIVFLRGYFGVLGKEQADKLNALNGLEAGKSVAKMLGRVFK